jgi:hypothetical protein
VIAAEVEAVEHTAMTDCSRRDAMAPHATRHEGARDRRPAASRWPLPAAIRLGGALLLLGLAAQSAAARDRGQYAGTPPDLKLWFDGLRSARGPCCSDADGSAVSDVDWESNNGRYRVRIDGQWIDVPDDAVITEPNRVGRTMVWPMYGQGGITIRCFMPGSMS